MPIPKNDESLPMGRYTTPVVGRLVALPTTNGNMTVSKLMEQGGLRKGVVAFDFPSMPDVIELARSADYYTNYSPVTPDGMHQYRGTKPLEIPLSFKLHAMDRAYCPYGAVTLLQLAARLHSFVLPLTSDGSTGATVAPLMIRDQGTPGASGTPGTSPGAALGETFLEKQGWDATRNTGVYQMTTANGKGSTTFPPVTCLLNLIWVSDAQPGIVCIGYVRDVRVRLMGPWLQGPTGEYDLPTAGEFEFTFIHRPSHTNNMGFTATATGYTNTPAMPEMQAFATDVRDRLYNTRNLVWAADYHGFTNEPTAATSIPDAWNSGPPNEAVATAAGVSLPVIAATLAAFNAQQVQQKALIFP